MDGNRLGLYLKARRDLLRPEDVGLPPSDARRRVHGLRREEVAALAGVSAQYYLRLEQGRDQHPSDQVLDALARALRLDASSTGYLYQLSRTAPPNPDTQASDVVDERTGWLLDTWTMTPAVVHSRYLDVIASNAAARALSPVFTAGINSLAALLLEPSQRAFYADWNGIAERSIALLRVLAGPDSDDDERLHQLVDQLTTESDLFRRVWPRRDVTFTSTGTHHINHPVVGALELHHKKLVLTGDNGQTIFLYHAAPGSTSEQSLITLVSAHADSSRVRP